MYIFQADLWCDFCAAKWMDENLDSSPENEDDHYSYDSDDWPKEVGDLENETDCPSHCCRCHIPLACSLTSDGVEYVFEYVREHIQDMENQTPEERLAVVYLENKDNPEYYYANCPGYAVTADWVKEVECHGGLTEEQENLIERFWELVIEAESLQENNS
ncbi:MAG TPA: hypothetical protein VGA67_02860 [Candidatus Dojkabacteria bacterium]